MSCSPIILFRASLAEEAEINICKNHFDVVEQRSAIPSGNLVIPRYSALPFYEELEIDVKFNGSTLINSWKQHCYVADLRNWYYHLGEYTPRTWFYMDQLPENGPFVLKGQTNSRKHNWKTHMFAKTKREAMEVFSLLSADSYIGTQQIYAREYVPLRKLCDGLQGLPISEEYRFFVLDGQILTGGFYWSNHTDYIVNDLGIRVDPNMVPIDWLQKIVDIVASYVRFFVIDVARTETNEWIVIELNDGQMSGLSDNSADVLYQRMRETLR